MRACGPAAEIALSSIVRATPGLNDALCALSFFRRRHIWKEAGTRKGFMRNFRIKDLSASGENKRNARAYIARARAAGWRGSIVAAIAAHSV